VRQPRSICGNRNARRLKVGYATIVDAADLTNAQIASKAPVSSIASVAGTLP
jgi:hypothetical protein